tara:strand:- start:150 stop:422 length:273 start_codon:yes stop_codon:yes gene_type:complete
MTWLSEMTVKEARSWEDLMVDYSYDSFEWKEARDRLIFLLSTDGKKSSEEEIRSYLACCAESVGSIHPLPELVEVVSDFYLEFGMENSSK